ncbi:hypothetical protein B6S12_07535, partial [Helicobacter valdiviensis]
LPSGGKFTNGSSGSINIGKGQGSCTTSNCMSISGNHKNNVIAWGGGFNIGKGYEVHFEKGKNGGNNYLNLDYSKNPSIIAGLLQGNNNNVFIVNPSGVIVEKGGVINANRFVASTTPMSIEEINAFSNPNTNSATWSPVFKANSTRGDIINKGSIQANEVVMVGNRVLLQAGVNLQEDGKIGVNKINANNINIEGNTIKVDISTIGNNKANLKVNAKKGGDIYLSTTGYYYGAKHNDFKGSITDNSTNKLTQSYTKQDTLSIASDIDWWHFAKGYNNKNSIQTIENFQLVNDVDFNANCKNGVCTGQNYANYWIDLDGDNEKDFDEYTSMIVGDYFNPANIYDKNNVIFTANFDGQGYTLKNINIDITFTENHGKQVGIFGFINGGEIENINVDYMGGGIKVFSQDHFDASMVGGFAGGINAGTFSNITINNIGSMSSIKSNNYNYMGSAIGGFAGAIGNGNYSNITINNIGSISSNDNRNDFEGSSVAGGFAGSIVNGNYSNIAVNNIGSISSHHVSNALGGAYVGGFAGSIGNGNYSNITLNDIGIIRGIRDGKYGTSYVGGFAGVIDAGTFSNITVSNIESIINHNSSSDGTIAYSDYNSYTGGFAGRINDGEFRNIVLNNIGSIIGNNSGEFNSNVGGFLGAIGFGKHNVTFSNITLNNIGSIISNSNDSNTGVVAGSFAGGFAGRLNSNLDEDDTFSNITLNNIGSISSISNRGSYTGGFAGKIDGGTFSNITINNIGSISSISNKGSYTGGFAGDINDGEFRNIVLNNIGSIIGNNSGEFNSNAGGFVGDISRGTFSNIYIYFNPNAIIKANSASGIVYVGKFFGNIYEGVLVDNFSNIHIYYNGSQEALDNPNSIANATSNEEKPFYNNGITLHPYTDKQDGFNNFYNDVTNFFKEENGNPQIYYNEKGGYYAFIDESNMGNGSNSGSNGNGDNSNNGNNEDSNFIDKNKDGLNDVILSDNDFSKDILNQILGNLKFDLLKEDAESIKQSLEFLLAFIGEDGLKELFSDYDVNNSAFKDKLTEKNIAVLYDFLKSEDYLSNIQNIKDYYNAYNDYMNKYNAYINNSGASIEAAKKALEKAYKTLLAKQSLLQNSYTKIQEGINSIGLGEIKLNHKTPILANNNTISFNLSNTHMILPPIPNKKDNGNQTITSPLKDINASMLDKQQVVLIKPAEEEKETLDEEKGVLNQRTCVVSENFKTNNPCILCQSLEMTC